MVASPAWDDMTEAEKKAWTLAERRLQTPAQFRERLKKLLYDRRWNDAEDAIAARDDEIAEEARRAMIDCYNNGREIEDDAIVRRMRAWQVHLGQARKDTGTYEEGYNEGRRDCQEEHDV